MKNLSRRSTLKSLAAAPFVLESLLSSPDPASASNSTRSRVVRVTDPRATDGTGGLDNVNLDDAIVKQMVEAGIREFFGADSIEKAWEEIIPDPAAKVAIKVNCEITSIYTKAKIVSPLIDGLLNRGVEADRIVVYDLGGKAFEVAGFQDFGRGISVGKSEAFGGFSLTTWFGNPIWGPNSRFCKVIAGQGKHGCDYLINVPVMKALDGYSGITMSMKNHFGSISDPESLHDTIHESIAALNAHELIRKKTRLILVDGIFAEYKWNWGRDQSCVAITNEILVGTDPVAIDTLGWHTLENLRKENGLGPIDPQPEFLRIADQEHGLGNSDPGKIEVMDLRF